MTGQGGRTALLDLKARLDEPALRELLAEAVGFSTAARMEAVCSAYRQEGWHLLGLEWDGALVGCIGLEVTAPGQAIIQHIAVVPERRGQGVGRALVAQAAAALHLEHLVAETDADAAGFYRQCGFAVQSLGEKYPGVERFSCRGIPARPGAGESGH